MERRQKRRLESVALSECGGERPGMPPRCVQWAAQAWLSSGHHRRFFVMSPTSRDATGEKKRISGSVTADGEWWGTVGSRGMYVWECLFCRNYLFSHFLSTTNTTLFLALPEYSLIRSSGFSQAASSWTEHDWFLAKAGGSGHGICHYWNRPQQESSWIIASICLEHVLAFLSGFKGWLRVLLLAGLICFFFFIP